jgi:hypothetical protein
MAKPEWVVLEKEWPTTINQSTDISSLVRGECRDLDMVSFETDGILQHASAPVPSPQFVVKEFVPAGTTNPTPDQIESVYKFGRLWRISEVKNWLVEYTDFRQSDDTSAFVTVGFLDFSEDGQTEVRMIIPGDDRWFVLKQGSGYVVENATGSSDSFKKSTAYYGIGCSNPGLLYSNAFMAGSIATAWDGGGEFDGNRHFLWDGKNGQLELSRNVRKIAESQGVGERCKISWSQNLVICGSLTYDLETKRIYHFSGNNFAQWSSRAYFEVHYRPITVRGFEFICTSDSGQFDVTMFYQRERDGTEKSVSETFTINQSNRQRFRHTWNLNETLSCRRYRLEITNLSGVGIYQISSLVEIGSSPNWEPV